MVLDAVVVRRDKENKESLATTSRWLRESKRKSNEGVGAVGQGLYCAWLYASQASCASRRTMCCQHVSCIIKLQ